MTETKTAPPAVTPMPSPEKPPATEPKPQRVPKKVRDAIDALTWGRAKTKKEAAEKFGHISREHFSRSFRNPAVVQYAQQASRRAAAMGLMRAVAVLDELLDSSSARVRLEAAKHLAGIGGIKPAPDANVNVNVGVAIAGYVIDLSEPGIDHKIVSGAVIENKPIEPKPADD